MQKNEVEEILIIVKSGQQEALSMKIYKDGIICRRGCGGLPEISISGMSFTGSSLVFDKLLSILPQEVLDQPVNYVEQKINSPLEYVVAFYGVSKNGQTGEHAEWMKSSGMRFLLDSDSGFNHPLLGFVDTFSLEAAELTNSWYFDIMVKAAFDVQSATLTEQTFIAVSRTQEETQNAFRNYLSQIRLSSRRWDLATFSKDKTYTSKNGIQVRPNFTLSGESSSFTFEPVESGPGSV
jgi:hypothetical protein